MKQLRKAVDLIKESERPVIFAGGGIILSKAAAELTEFARKTQIPLTTSLMGLGAFPGTDPLWLGMIGMHGTYRANMSTSACDLIISIGVRFDDRVTGKTDTFASQAKIVHIDIDPTSIRKNIPVTIPIVGDCKTSLSLLNDLVEQADLEDLGARREKWFAQIEEWKSTKPLAYKQEDTIKPQFVVEKLYELTNGEAIIRPRWAKTRCGPPNIIILVSPTILSHPAVWARWDLVCRRPSALRSPAPISW
jgi:acetolactate synthase-1/2/3 large subunit